MPHPLSNDLRERVVAYVDTPPRLTIVGGP